jgi:hypothetical protein
MLETEPPVRVVPPSPETDARAAGTQQHHNVRCFRRRFENVRLDSRSHRDRPDRRVAEGETSSEQTPVNSKTLGSDVETLRLFTL